MTDAESLFAAIHEHVALQAHDASWPAGFADERARLLALFPVVLIDVQHIGSTAVDGLVAKPIIDILAGVESMAVDASLAQALGNAGYSTSAAFNATLTDRQWFMRWADGRRTHHLHVVVHGGSVWNQRLGFRDALRASAALRERYAALKSSLAALHPNDREAYTDAKAGFIRAVTAGG